MTSTCKKTISIFAKSNLSSRLKIWWSKMTCWCWENSHIKTGWQSLIWRVKCSREFKRVWCKTTRFSSLSLDSWISLQRYKKAALESFHNLLSPINLSLASFKETLLTMLLTKTWIRRDIKSLPLCAEWQQLLATIITKQSHLRIMYAIQHQTSSI